jgi:hypothetical protein
MVFPLKRKFLVITGDKKEIFTSREVFLAEFTESGVKITRFRTLPGKHRLLITFLGVIGPSDYDLKSPKPLILVPPLGQCFKRVCKETYQDLKIRTIR